MTIKEAVSVLKDIKRVHLAWNGTLHDLDISEPVVMDAFGSYLVSGIYAIDEDVFEIELAVRPIKQEG